MYEARFRSRRFWISQQVFTTVTAALIAVSLSPDAALAASETNGLVDCLLPAQVRKLGSKLIFISPRVTVQTSPTDCEIRGGDYPALNRRDHVLTTSQRRSADGESP